MLATGYVEHLLDSPQVSTLPKVPACQRSPAVATMFHGRRRAYIRHRYFQVHFIFIQHSALNFDAIPIGGQTVEILLVKENFKWALCRFMEDFCSPCRTILARYPPYAYHHVLGLVTNTYWSARIPTKQVRNLSGAAPNKHFKRIANQY
jgi:hypothetical protein